MNDRGLVDGSEYHVGINGNNIGGSEYRVGIDGNNVDETIIDAICESISKRDEFDVDADEVVVLSIHIEPGESSYVEVCIDK